MRPRDRRRKLVLADLVILIAVVALTCASLRATLDFLPFRGISLRRPTLLGRAERWLDFLLFQGVPLLGVASLAVAALGLRPLHRLARRPGFLLCAAAVAASALAVLVVGTFKAFVEKAEPSFAVRGIVAFSVPHAAGFAVLGAWLAMICTEHGRPARSIIDRAGYALGMTWVAVCILAYARYLLLRI